LTATREVKTVEAVAMPIPVPKERMTLSTPAASPVGFGGAAPMIELLFAEVKSPWPTPNSASATGMTASHKPAASGPSS
jgi:hypothetical protein